MRSWHRHHRIGGVQGQIAPGRQVSAFQILHGIACSGEKTEDDFKVHSLLPLTLPASERRCGSLAFLADAIEFEDFPEDLNKDADIQSEGPVIDVPHIQIKLFIPAEGVAAIHFVAPMGFSARPCSGTL